MQSANKKKAVRYCKAPLSKKVREGGFTVVSEALVKKSVSNLIPKIHVKRGDLVKVVSGSKEMGKGKTGKVLQVLPKKGMVIVEGVNIKTHHVKQRQGLGGDGIVKKESPIFASKVMLFDPQSKKAVRKEFRKKLSL
ncbi:MAG TPA: 50S ribosomal protein L24 [Candidatus Melainabacteria bacterium]|nr:50S ribosomal protein L24 [Candidatus Melainabacteria bacterium]